jgi:hypothetical protein
MGAGALPVTAGTARRPISDLLLTSPDDGAVFHLTPELARQSQSLRLEAVTTISGVDHVRFVVDGLEVASAAGPTYRAIWPLVDGSHVEAVDASGRAVARSEAHITVVAP